MRTRFKVKAFLPIVLSILLLGIILNFSHEILTNSFYQNKLLPTLITLAFFIIVFLWLILGEVKNKFIVVNFDEKKIFVKKFGGFFPKVEYDSKEIEGWKYSILPSRGGNDEYLYIYHNGKKIAKVSEFYHRNYLEIKQYVKNNYKDLGFEQFSYRTELKEIFD